MMATLERTMAVITQVLDAGGVVETDELQEQGYRIGARGLFIEAAARGLRSKPRKTWHDEDIVAKGRMFVMMMPRIYATEEDESYPMPGGDFLVQNRWFTGMGLAPKQSGFSRKIVRPSISYDGVVTELHKDLDHTALRHRAERIAREATTLMRRIMGPLFGDDTILVHRANPYEYTFSMRFASGMPWSKGFGNDKLLHDADVKLLATFRSLAEGMVVGECDFLGHDGRETLQNALDFHAHGTALPIGLRLAAAMRESGQYGGPRMNVLLEGYGVGGRREIQVIRTINMQINAASLTAVLKNDDKLKRQKQLHYDYGPVPGRKAVPMVMDGPSARMLARTGRGADIARALSIGLPGDGGDVGVTFRFKAGHILGTFEMAPGVIWKGDRLDVQMTQISDVMAAALPGRGLRDVVCHDAFNDDDLVRKVEQRRSATANTLVVHARPRMVALDDIDALAA